MEYHSQCLEYSKFSSQIAGDWNSASHSLDASCTAFPVPRVGGSISDTERVKMARVPGIPRPRNDEDVAAQTADDAHDFIDFRRGSNRDDDGRRVVDATAAQERRLLGVTVIDGAAPAPPLRDLRRGAIGGNIRHPMRLEHFGDKPAHTAVPNHESAHGAVLRRLDVEFRRDRG